MVRHPATSAKAGAQCAWCAMAAYCSTRNQRQRRVPAGKMPPSALKSNRLGLSRVLTLSSAISTAGEAHLLAFQVQCLNNILEPPEPVGRDGAIQHLPRELRLVQTIIRALAIYPVRLKTPLTGAGHLRSVTHHRHYRRDIPATVTRCQTVGRHQAFSRRTSLTRNTSIVNATRTSQRKHRPGARGGVRGRGIERRA